MKKLLTAIGISLLLAACSILEDYSTARREMDVAHSRIYSILQSTRIRNTDSYVVGRVVFELGVYDRALQDAALKAKELAMTIANAKTENTKTISAVFTPADWDTLQQQFADIKTSFADVEALCAQESEDNSISCNNYRGLNREIPIHMDMLQEAYLRILKKF